MPLDRAATDLVDFMQTKVGQGLRGVVSYTTMDAELVYLREDLQGLVNLGDFEPTSQQARGLHEQLVTVAQLQGRTLGSPLANVTVFERSIVLVFMYDDEQGVIATLDREVGRKLAGFIEECSSVLQAG